MEDDKTKIEPNAKKISRRSLLKGGAAVAGAAVKEHF